MLKRLVSATWVYILCALIIGTPLAFALGTFTSDMKDMGSGLYKLTLGWTADTDGTLTARVVGRYAIKKALVVPSATAVPSDNFDIAFHDISVVPSLNITYYDAADAGFNTLQNLDNTTVLTANYHAFKQPAFADGFDVAISGAGNGGAGTLVLWLQRDVDSNIEYSVDGSDSLTTATNNTSILPSRTYWVFGCPFAEQ